MKMEMKESNIEAHELSLNELDEVSAGYVWIAVVVVSFAAGTAIRMGIDWALKRLF